MALAFTLASDNVGPVRVQSLSLQVVEVLPYRRSTFPAYDLGGNGAEPIVGWTEINPQEGTYKVETDRRPQVGNGIEPADFHIRVFCREGYKYKLRIVADWIDVDHQEKSGRFVSDDFVTLEEPSITRWKELASTSNSIRIFYDGYGGELLKELKSLSWQPDYTIMLSRLFLEKEDVLANPNVFMIPPSETNAVKQLYALVGGAGSSTQTRNFMLLGSSYLLLQNDDWVTSEIIQDPSIIESVSVVYSVVIEQIKATKS